MAIRSFVRSVAVAFGLLLATGPALAQDNSELLQRVERLDSQIRTLTALIEELGFRVQDLEQLVQVLSADNAALYEILDAAGIDPFAALGNAPAATPAPALNAPALDAPVVVEAPISQPAQNEPQLGAPPQNLGVVPLDPGAGGPLDLAGALRPDGGFNLDGAPLVAGPGASAIAPPASITPQADSLPQSVISGDPIADYNAGYQLVLNGDYAQAEIVFGQFLASYPGNALTVDARFWRAESMLSRGMYRDAATEFYDAYIANPDHEKAPDMLLKLGISMAALGQIESACGTFDQVQQRYPAAPNALLQRVQAERINAGC